MSFNSRLPCKTYGESSWDSREIHQQMSDGDDVHQLLHGGCAEQLQQGVHQHSVSLHQVAETRRRLLAVSCGANVGGLSVLCECCPAQDTDCHVDHHLQQNLGKSQQYVEVCQTLSYHSGINGSQTNCFHSTNFSSSLMRILFCHHPSHFSPYWCILLKVLKRISSPRKVHCCEVVQKSFGAWQLRI